MSDHDFHIEIDREHFDVAAPQLTGSELRALPDPPIGDDRDLWEEERGPGDDKLIENDATVEMRDGLRFFTTPRTINPGNAQG